MKQFFLLAIFFAFSSFYCFEVKATSGTVIANGDWSDTTSWLFNGIHRAPTCGDSLFIPAGHTISVNSQQNYSGCSSTFYLEVGGTLQFVNGFKLTLPCNSIVKILAGGVLRKSSPGGGNSTLIDICGRVVWSADDGEIHGPVTFGGESLPITLEYFDAQPAENGVSVVWITSSQINNSYFTIERSADGEQFKDVAYIKGAGNSTALITYRYLDRKPFEGVSYYRLMQTDYDGTFTFSNAVVVNYIAESKLQIISATVNESSNFNINFKDIEGGKFTLQIHDLLGKVIYQTIVEEDSGLNNIQLTIPELTNGIYFVTMTNKRENTASKKFIRSM